MSERTVGVQSAKRYFYVDEARGTLSYAKKETKKPTVVLPLADITSVRPLDGGEPGIGRMSNCFIISCPPVHLTVRAEDREVGMHARTQAPPRLRAPCPLPQPPLAAPLSPPRLRRLRLAGPFEVDLVVVVVVVVLTTPAP